MSHSWSPFDGSDAHAEPRGGAPGRAALTARLAPRTVVLRTVDRAGARDDDGVAPDAGDAVDRAGGSRGAPLPDGVRDRFESSLGVDLSAVRVHTGADSAVAADAVGARAYATGNDIHFAAGQYAPTDPFGLHLLAHEVAHTVQQSGGSPAPQYELEVSQPGDPCEVEADRAADAMVAGESARLGGNAGVARRAVQRDAAPPAATGANARMIAVQQAIAAAQDRVAHTRGTCDGLLGKVIAQIRRLATTHQSGFDQYKREQEEKAAANNKAVAAYFGEKRATEQTREIFNLIIGATFVAADITIAAAGGGPVVGMALAAIEPSVQLPPSEPLPPKLASVAAPSTAPLFADCAAILDAMNARTVCDAKLGGIASQLTTVANASLHLQLALPSGALGPADEQKVAGAEKAAAKMHELDARLVDLLDACTDHLRRATQVAGETTVADVVSRLRADGTPSDFDRDDRAITRAVGTRAIVAGLADRPLYVQLEVDGRRLEADAVVAGGGARPAPGESRVIVAAHVEPIGKTWRPPVVVLADDDAPAVGAKPMLSRAPDRRLRRDAAKPTAKPDTVATRLGAASDAIADAQRHVLTMAKQADKHYATIAGQVVELAGRYEQGYHQLQATWMGANNATAAAPSVQKELDEKAEQGHEKLELEAGIATTALATVADCVGLKYHEAHQIAVLLVGAVKVIGLVVTGLDAAPSGGGGGSYGTTLPAPKYLKWTLDAETKLASQQEDTAQQLGGVTSMLAHTPPVLAQAIAKLSGKLAAPADAKTAKQVDDIEHDVLALAASARAGADDVVARLADVVRQTQAQVRLTLPGAIARALQGGKDDTPSPVGKMAQIAVPCSPVGQVWVIEGGKEPQRWGARIYKQSDDDPDGVAPVGSFRKVLGMDGTILILDSASTTGYQGTPVVTPKDPVQWIGDGTHDMKSGGFQYGIVQGAHGSEEGFVPDRATVDETPAYLRQDD